KVLISGGFSGAYERLVPEFEQASGIKVTTGSGASQGDGPQTIGAQLAGGERADVVSVSREGLDGLIAATRHAAGTDVETAATGRGRHWIAAGEVCPARRGRVASWCLAQGDRVHSNVFSRSCGGLERGASRQAADRISLDHARLGHDQGRRIGAARGFKIAS